MKTAAPLTITKDGRTYLAKAYKGDVSRMTYANRTQAERAAEKVGGFVVHSPMYRPFYVAVTA